MSRHPFIHGIDFCMSRTVAMRITDANGNQFEFNCTPDMHVRGD